LESVQPAAGLFPWPRALLSSYARSVTGLRTLDRAVGLGPGDHASWAYDDVSELRSACLDYFSDGLTRSERLVYVGGRPRDALLDDLMGLPGRDALLADGRLSVHTLIGHLENPGDLAPRVQLEARRAAAQDAVAAGYAGLRVAGDITELVRRPYLVDPLVEFELAVDAAMSTTTVTTLCALDRQETGERWRLVSALHAIQHSPGRPPSFALRRSGSAVTLVGEIDIACVQDLDGLLDHLLRTTTGAVTFELPDLEFIDVAGTRRLAVFQRAMAAVGRTVLFRRLSPAARRTFRAFALVDANDL
jgi:anti-anti-sigma regulatory factor